MACVSLWPGMVKTELNEAMPKLDEIMAGDAAESIEFSGKGVVALAENMEAALERSGKIVMTTELGEPPPVLPLFYLI